MTDQFRAMCVELIEAVLSDDSHIDCMQIARRARALLAEPEQDSVIPVKQHIFPTPSQAAECGGPCYEGSYCPEACDCGLYQPPALPQPVAEGPTDEELLRCAKIATPCYDLKLWERELNMMRAAIAADRARRGRPTPQPVAEGPTDEEIHDFIALWWEDFGKGYLPCSSDEPLVKAALARFGGRPTPQPVAEGPTDQELLHLYQVATPCYSVEEYKRELDFARAVLARWGRPAAAPLQQQAAPVPEAEPGEVPAAWLYLGEPDFDGTTWRENWDVTTYEQVARFKAQPDCPVPLFRRPATLLQQQAAPVPGASNTYFEFVIFDADDCTQAEGIAPTYAQALSEGQHYLAQYQQDGPHTLELRRVEVLNPDALPLPAPEETK